MLLGVDGEDALSRPRQVVAPGGYEGYEEQGQERVTYAWPRGADVKASEEHIAASQCRGEYAMAVEGLLMRAHKGCRAPQLGVHHPLTQEVNRGGHTERRKACGAYVSTLHGQVHYRRYKQQGTQGKEQHPQPFQPLLPLYLLIITCYIQHIALSPFLVVFFVNVFFVCRPLFKRPGHHVLHILVHLYVDAGEALKQGIAQFQFVFHLHAHDHTLGVLGVQADEQP